MEIREEMPLSAELTAKKQAFDAEVAKVFTGEDTRKGFALDDDAVGRWGT